jgi:hypothetical protein
MGRQLMKTANVWNAIMISREIEYATTNPNDCRNSHTNHSITNNWPLTQTTLEPEKSWDIEAHLKTWRSSTILQYLTIIGFLPWPLKNF